VEKKTVHKRTVRTMIDTQITGEAIPKKGLKKKVMLYVEHVCGEKNFIKFFLNGFVFLFCKELPTVFGSYMRPLVYKMVLGKVGHGCLFERSVRIDIPSRFFIGDRVFLGQNCWINPGGKTGEIRFGNDAFVAHFCTLRAEGGRIIIGNNAQISRNCYLNGAGDIEIGDDTMLGPNISVVSVSHVHSRPDIPMRLQGVKKARIHIESDVWIGANATVSAGATIGKGAVVGAGAVVTKDIPPYSIAVGVPAKVIRSRE